jgi:catechol 2,3-dioxygenase-like lactoylglutathione lyase family enzyme
MHTRGIDHLAFVTDDLPTTMDFYTRVLGMRLVHVRRVPFERDRGQPPYENLRHYFFDMGNDSLLAFFEYPQGLPRQNRDLPGGMQHIAFHLAPGKFDGMVERVKAAGLELATDRSGEDRGVVESVLQTEEEARAELETLFSDPREVEKWLRHMPLKQAEPV